MSHVVVWFDSEYLYCSINQIQPREGAAAFSPGPAPEGVCGCGGERSWCCMGRARVGLFGLLFSLH